MRILFTGASSFAGRRLFALLRATGHRVTAVSRRPFPDETVDCCRVDLAADDSVQALPRESFDALVHFASYVPLDERSSTWRECSRCNVASMARLLEWADGRVGRLMLASSCAVYGTDTQYTPVDERHPLRPDTAYAVSKYAQEQLAQAFCRSRSLPLVILRLGYVIGPGITESRLVMSLVRQVRDGRAIHLTNARTAGLHLIHQDDVARIGDALLAAGDGTYNVVPPRHITLWEYATTVMDVLGRRVELTSHDSPGASVTNFYSCRRLRERHGLQPDVPLARAIAELA